MLVIDTGEDEWSPTWNADGSRIVFSSSRTDPGYVYRQTIWIMNADGSDLLPLVRDWDVAGNPAVSPVR